MEISPYLSFNGDCEKAFKFYEKALGGKVSQSMTYKGTPMEKDVPADWQNKIIHTRMDVGKHVIMGADCMPPYFQEMKGMHVSLNIASAEEAEKIFKALSEGANVQMPIQETFWAERFAMLVDQFGTPWMINCEKKR